MIPKVGKQTGKAVLICLVLGLLVLAVFGQTLRFGFVNYDDNLYVSNEPMVSQGLSPAGVAWAFTHTQAANWHPLTGLSLMLDATLYRSWTGGFHLTNVLLHLATVIALFLVLRSMTGSLWRSAFVAALFAIHPLRVESVAWISERKDVLSGLFFMLTLGTYLRYVRVSSVECRGCRPLSSGSYWLTLVFFALGLMSKPMLVTLPFVLLLLDFWPLGRVSAGSIGQGAIVGRASRIREPVQRENTRRPADRRVLQSQGHQRSTINYQFFFRLIAEKIPLLGLSLAACAATVLAQGGALETTSVLALSWRLANAAVSYIVYIVQMVWPAGLVPLYLFRGPALPSWQIAASLAALLMVSGVVFFARRRHPALLTGWLWYLGMLLPVIGIMQVGFQAHADRYTYLPQIGLYVMVVWFVTDVCSTLQYRRFILPVAAAVTLAALAGAAYRQTGFWRDSEVLWTHTLACTEKNFIAYSYLGGALLEQGRDAEAIGRLEQSIRINPYYSDPYYNLGVVAGAQGRIADSVPYYEKALQLKPGFYAAHFNLGSTFLRLGNPDRAVACYQQALKIMPEEERAVRKLKQAQEAQAQQRAASALKKFYEQALQVQVQGDISKAVALYRQALERDPQFLPALNNLAWILATCAEVSLRDGAQAVELAQRADQLSGGSDPSLLDTLAAAYAEAGRFPEATETAKRALELGGNDAAAADRLRERIRQYEEGKAWRENVE